MWGAWLRGPARPSSSTGALPAASSLCPHHTQPGPLALPFPLCSGGPAGAGRAAEKGGDGGDGGGRNAWAGTPGCRRPPLSLGAPPATHCSAAAWPLGAVSHLRGTCSCCHRVSAGPVLSPSFPPSTWRPISALSVRVSFLQEADLGHGMVSGGYPYRCHHGSLRVSSLILIPTGVCFMDLTFTLCAVRLCAP